MRKSELSSQIRKKGSFLCVGLDPDLSKLPATLPKDADGVFTFCRDIVQATAPYCMAYKLNIAFFEALGRNGWDALYRVREILPDDCFLIADAKRADIGNTSKKYAHAFFKELDFDAITVAPYMGQDSVKPFLEYDDKWTILLALTSNLGALDFQMIADMQGYPLYRRVIASAAEWGNEEQLMFVIGATQTEYLADAREIAPGHFFLIPGVGAQGGDLDSVAAACMTPDVGMLVNSSREILYASSGPDYADAAQAKAMAHTRRMSELLQK